MIEKNFVMLKFFNSILNKLCKILVWKINNVYCAIKIEMLLNHHKNIKIKLVLVKIYAWYLLPTY